MGATCADDGGDVAAGFVWGQSPARRRRPVLRPLSTSTDDDHERPGPWVGPRSACRGQVATGPSAVGADVCRAATTPQTTAATRKTIPIDASPRTPPIPKAAAPTSRAGRRTVGRTTETTTDASPLVTAAYQMTVRTSVRVRSLVGEVRDPITDCTKSVSVVQVHGGAGARTYDAASFE